MAWLGGKGNGSKAPPLRPFPHLLCAAKLTSQFGTKKVQLLQDEVHMLQEGQKTKTQWQKQMSSSLTFYLMPLTALNHKR